MKKKTTVHTQTSRHTLHFYALFALLAVSVGVIGTLKVTKILADSSEVIYSCVTSSNGNVRITTATDACKQSEYPR